MSLETEHNGYKINYAENEDIWRCYALDLDAKTLSQVKAKISAELKRERAVEAMPALCFDSTFGIEAKEVVVTLIADEKRVWVMGTGMGRQYYSTGNQTGRSKMDIDRLIADTPENRVALAEMADLAAQAEAMRKRAEAAKAAIPRLTMDDLKRVEKEPK